MLRAGSISNSCVTESQRLWQLTSIQVIRGCSFLFSFPPLKKTFFFFTLHHARFLTKPHVSFWLSVPQKPSGEAEPPPTMSIFIPKHSFSQARDHRHCVEMLAKSMIDFMLQSDVTPVFDTTGDPVNIHQSSPSSFHG